MSLFDQKPKIATKAHATAKWGGVPNAELFRCYLCGHKFEEGDVFRNVRPEKNSPNSPFLTCETCDGPDVIERWDAANDELKKRFWWA